MRGDSQEGAGVSAAGMATVARPPTGERSIADEEAERGRSPRREALAGGEVLELDETTGKWVYHPSPGKSVDWDAEAEEWRDRDSNEVLDLPPPKELEDQIARKSPRRSTPPF